MEYYNKQLCISARELIDKGIVSSSNYKQLSARGRIRVVRRGGGAAGCCALIAVDSLPPAYKEKVNALYPEKHRIMVENWLRENYEVDQRAMAYYSSPSECGIDLPIEKVNEYVTNASVLNCALYLYSHTVATNKLFKERFSWERMCAVIEGLRDLYGHTLPSSTLRFRKKANEYKKGGYGVLISGKFGNQAARKVDHKTEKLIIGISCLPNKPFNSNVAEMYNQFVCGELEVYDPETGELFDPEEFVDKNGNPKELSESTISNYLNRPKNRLLIAKAHESYTTFMHEQMPHMHRHAGAFSLSQITMDDVDLTRKLKDTKQRIHAYYAYDVVSQCVIGASYARKKDERLVLDCFRDMFRLIDRQGWGMPAGIEVENHLMTQYKSGFLQAGVAFPFVRFCAAQNSQEKYAEPLNGAKKRSIIHKNHEGIGRFYGKGKWRTESKKVSDATNELYEDKQYYTYDELVADDRRDCAEWNAALHPNQKKYPNMSRWDVLVANINPTLQPLDKLTLARYIGQRVETSVRRNSTVRVMGEDWWLSKTEVLERLAPNNYKVIACYLPDEEGQPTEVHLFQGDRYIDTVERVETYNRVMAEQTTEDHAKFAKQQQKVAKFSKYVAENAVPQVSIIKPEVKFGTSELLKPTPSLAEIIVSPPAEDEDDYYLPPPATDYRARALESL